MDSIPQNVWYLSRLAVFLDECALERFTDEEGKLGLIMVFGDSFRVLPSDCRVEYSHTPFGE